MSNVNVKRLVDNIRSGTNVYTPLVELVVNAIQAIEQTGTNKGSVQIEVLRNGQEDILEQLEEVDGFRVTDNGVGFTQLNRDSFDELYTEQKIADGGKGFGRFTCLKYFDLVNVKSIFEIDGKFQARSFDMGLGKDIIVNELLSESTATTSGTTVELTGLKATRFPDKRIETISRVIVERLLPYFIEADRICPQITIRDSRDGSSPLSLNDYIGKENSQIVELGVTTSSFVLKTQHQEKSFHVRVFKFFAPRAAKSKISLVAHRREVTDNPLQSHIPEFADEFYEPAPDRDTSRGRNFIIKAYVFGDYLNENVTLERGEFRFQIDTDLLGGISQNDIEAKAATIAQSAIGSEIAERKKRKEARITEYISSDAPWHGTLASEVDFSALPMKPTNQEIELHLQKKKYEKEVATRNQVAAVLNSDNPGELSEKIAQLMESISETSKNDLAHYVSMRWSVLELFSKSLEIDSTGKHKSEGDVHDIIMRRKKDSDELDYNAHNLWILDERLNFSSYVSSDKPLKKGARDDRTDITVYNHRVAFRGENESSNPITIFEFKKPQRDDFADPSSKEDPVQQIVRYVNKIREGEFKTPGGRDILVQDTTPFYGYVVCDLTPKVRKWLDKDKNFTPMPDGLGWFHWFGNINLYMEVISWTKLLRDAEMRNKIFFHKLGIS